MDSMLPDSLYPQSMKNTSMSRANSESVKSRFSFKVRCLENASFRWNLGHHSMSSRLLLPNTGVGIYDKVLKENMGKRRRHWAKSLRFSQVGTPQGKLTLRVYWGYLRKDWHQTGRDGSSQVYTSGGPTFRENIPYSQQLQGRQVGKHSVLDFGKRSIYQAPAGKREAKQGLGLFQKWSQDGQPAIFSTCISNSSTQKWGLKSSTRGGFSGVETRRVKPFSNELDQYEN